MQSAEIRKKFLTFFAARGHAIMPSASLVPENDPSVLFNTAGMQPLVPYLLGQKHPLGTRIADVQKCVRTGDLDDIGDNRHFSFFEMMGNWSLGDYFKKEAIAWSYEFLTSKEEGLGLDPSRLYITIFEGDSSSTPDLQRTGAPYDQESKDIWMSLGIPEHRIYALPADDNWWSPGDNGPCGPCSEMFYDMTDNGIGDLDKEGFISATKAETIIEIWNDVFMEYEKKDGAVIGKLSQKNVDTGAGLERITAVMQGKKTAYETDLFLQAGTVLDALVDASTPAGSQEQIIKAKRIVLDHFRTALFLASDGVTPANKGAGYIMRRLIRRGVLYFQSISMAFGTHYEQLLDAYVSTYQDMYPELVAVKNTGYKIILEEVAKFQSTLATGLKEFQRGIDPFTLATTYGFPIELTLELAAEEGIRIDMDDFNKKMTEHQNLSRTASAGMFKGGLANHNEKTVRLHTAHHLLLAALQSVLGKSVHQKGSNITEERLRLDFAFDRKMTDEEKKHVEDLVNEKIKAGLSVIRREMPKEEAERLGAEMEFGAKYADVVSVYFIEDKEGSAFSKEFCGGPHVSNTSELGHFRILKEEAVSAGIRRIKAVLE